MHQPDTAPRRSTFYQYQVHPFRTPPELAGGRSDAPVVIVGAGPIGLVTAIDLARFGVRSIVLEQDAQVSHGSRAIVLTRRSMEILQQAGVDAPFTAKGLPWSSGRSFFRGHEVYRMMLPHDDDDRFHPCLNIQQQYIEQFLLEAAERTGRIDLRWGSKVLTIAQDPDGARLTVDTPAGEYVLAAPWVVAADGGRSAIRRLMGLRMEGRAYAGNFVIADIKAPLGLPTERLCYFDPEWNPGNNVLVHRQPDDLWRLDFRLPDGETAEEALAPARLSARIEQILAMVGRRVDWVLDWAAVYSASTLTLAEYRHGRVLFAGDAAHLLPIFGVRGANTGLQDAGNLGWKLAMVARGEAPPALLDSYSAERVEAAREICEEAGKSTRFMTPPTAGFRLLRDAVLSLALTEEFCRDLLHWRTSRPHAYRHSALNGAGDDFDGGFAPGEPIRNVRLGPDDFLFDHLKSGFHLIGFGAGALPLPRLTVPVITIAVGSATLPDPDGRIAAKFAAPPGSAYLVRPDLHVAARWLQPSADAVAQALRIATAQGPSPARGRLDGGIAARTPVGKGGAR